jgi:hypothetical protein
MAMTPRQHPPRTVEAFDDPIRPMQNNDAIPPSIDNTKPHRTVTAQAIALDTRSHFGLMFWRQHAAARHLADGRDASAADATGPAGPSTVRGAGCPPDVRYKGQDFSAVVVVLLRRPWSMTALRPRCSAYKLSRHRTRSA